MVNEVMREQYDEPYFLYHEEFKTILKTDVPESLSSTKDAFLLQCAIGCRISDFRKLMMDNIAITEDTLCQVSSEENHEDSTRPQGEDHPSDAVCCGYHQA